MVGRQPIDPPCSREELLAMLSYDPANGEIRWLAPGHRKTVGVIAGGIHKGEDRRRIGIDKRQYYSSQLIWFMVTGYWPRWPDEYVDHRDTYGLKRDWGDRWDNLRLSSPLKNQWNRMVSKNNTSGYPGVTQTRPGTWIAGIRAANEIYHLGTFRSFADAAQARKKAEIRLYGEYRAQHNGV